MGTIRDANGDGSYAEVPGLVAADPVIAKVKCLDLQGQVAYESTKCFAGDVF